MTIEMEIRVAAVGWEYATWEGNFYPSDLPEDWRLAYYSNEFRAVVIPSAQWRVAEKAQLDAWLEDIPDDFQFYLEVVESENDWADFVAMTQYLGRHLGGIILRPPVVDTDPEEIASALPVVTAIAPVSLVLPDGQTHSAVVEEVLKNNGVELVLELKTSVEMDAELRLTLSWQGDSRLAVVTVSDNLNYSA